MLSVPDRYKKWLKLLPVILIFAFAISKRFSLFYQPGSDQGTYIEAIETLLSGGNPYTDTVETYKHLDTNPGNKGFASLPGMLYINGFLSSIHIFLTNLFPCQPATFEGFCTPLPYFWKVPILLADIGIGIILLKYLYKKNYFVALTALAMWYFHPFMVLKNDYITSDPITIFFMLLALYKLGKDDVISGASYAFSIATKTFPIFLLPIMLFKSKDKVKFILSGLIVALAVSLPFMTSWESFSTFVQGAVLVHGTRFMQGRPFLFYISYLFSIELIQITPLKVFTSIASFGGWVVTAILYLKNWLQDKYALSLLSFAIFYFFTPVLNRTFLLWFIPILSIGLYNFLYENEKLKKYRFLYYVISIVFWVFYYWYLAQWEDGFHIHARI